jgi:hypothetical protein
MTEEAIPSKASYAGVDEAKAAMFDTVLYLRSKSQMAHPGLLCKEAE